MRRTDGIRSPEVLLFMTTSDFLQVVLLGLLEGGNPTSCIE